MIEREWFFDGWSPVVRILIVGLLAYLALVIVLRVSGKRTLSKMNSFDFVVTIALGSTFASVIISKSTALIEGIVALALLIALQFVVAWLSARSAVVDRLVKAEPVMLLYQGRMLRDAMRRERVAEDEVLAALRANGLASPEAAEAVVLESAGTFTVVPKSKADGGGMALEKVRMGKGGAAQAVDRRAGAGAGQVREPSSVHRPTTGAGTTA